MLLCFRATRRLVLGERGEGYQDGDQGAKSISTNRKQFLDQGLEPEGELFGASTSTAAAFAGQTFI